MQELPETKINGLTDEQSAPHVVSVSFAGVRSEVLLHALEERGIYVSSGSRLLLQPPGGKRNPPRQSVWNGSFWILRCDSASAYLPQRRRSGTALQMLSELLPVLSTIQEEIACLHMTICFMRF